MLSWFYKGGFSGTSFVCDKWLPQSHRPARVALNRQGGSVEPPESFAHQDKPGALSPCGAERKAGSRTSATLVLQKVSAKKMAVAIFS